MLIRLYLGVRRPVGRFLRSVGLRAPLPAPVAIRRAAKPPPYSYTLPGECNFCGGTTFENKKDRIDSRCLTCGSLERTRLLWMHLNKYRLGPHHRILHLAPEEALYNVLKDRHGANYVAADLEPENFPFADGMVPIDLTRLDHWESAAFDIIVHSHVMEHIPCTLAYPLYHLHRMLKPKGRHVCVIPFLPGTYDECFAALPQGERMRRFGQNDHVRRFGVEDVEQHLGKLVVLPDPYDAEREFGAETLDRARVPPHMRHGLTTATVLDLARGDMRLFRRP
ncbi:MAG: methyltransferase domain-containing protein [Jannaschia sp.]